jgi:putative ABC transport system permease protein
MGIPVLKGRDFTTADTDTALPVAIINQTMARKYWPGEDPLGKRLTTGRGPSREIVGIVGDVRHSGLDQETQEEIYVPYQQDPIISFTLFIRTNIDPMSVVASVKAEVQMIDKDQPVSRFKTMDGYLHDSIAHPRFQSYLVAIFAALGAILAVLGIYGVISHSVARRTHEIGIRMALGAQPIDVLSLIIKQGLVLILSGIVIGLVTTLMLVRLVKSMIFGLATVDPVTFTVITLLLTGVALLACFIPARRATKVDPIASLRCE